MGDVLLKGAPATQPVTPIVRRRRPLPSGRAVVGAFLIALAVIGTFAAYTRSSAPPVTRYAVAARALAPGDRVTPDSVRLVAIELPDAQRRRSFDALPPLYDLTVTEPLLEGELLQEGAVVATGAPSGARAVSFAVPASRAVDASVAAGERIDLLVTYGSNDKSCTHLVAADVLVTRVARAGDAVTGQSDVTLTVAVSSADDELAVAHAAAAGTVTIARTTDAAGEDAPQAEMVCSPAAPAPVEDG